MSYYFRESSSFLHTVKIIVTKQAVPPMKLETGSARKTPFIPSPPTVGSHSVSGMTMIAFRSREKNTACFAFPSAVNVDYPANYSDIIKIPKKYKCIAGTPSANNSGSLLNM